MVADSVSSLRFRDEDTEACYDRAKRVLRGTILNMSAAGVITRK
jgi:hypothetical protein